MKKLYLKNYNTLIEFNKCYNQIVFEDNIVKRRTLLNVMDNFIFSIDNEEFDINKIPIIYEPINIDLNNKKMINYLYKSLINECNETLKREFELKLYEFINQLCFQSDFKLEYSENINISELLNIVNLKYEKNIDDNFLEYIIKYIKLLKEIFKIEFIIFNDLSNYLSSNEIVLLNDELKLIDVIIVDINSYFIYNKDCIVIDSDNCLY